MAMVTSARRRAAAGGPSGATTPVLHLDKGEPDFDTPAHITAAGVRALRAGHTRYVAPEGIGELRDAVAEQLRARGVPAAAERVVIAAGAKPMLAYTVKSIGHRNT